MRILTLVDTSVWIDHFNKPIPRVHGLVADQAALCHPLIIGEMACGRMPARKSVIEFLQALHGATVPDHAEVMGMVESLELFGRGLTWIDANLIASSLLSKAYLYTHDRRLLAAASELGLLAPA